MPQPAAPSTVHELVKSLNGRTREIRIVAGNPGSAIEVRRVAYTEVLRGAGPMAGAVIFSDIQMLAPGEQEMAARIWHRLARSGQPVRLFNHPLRSMRRYEFLREMHERGTNPFDAYTLLEARPPRRYPVYLSKEAGKNEIPVELLAGPDDVVPEVGKLVALALGREGRILIEFTGLPDERGRYRRYCAICIGDSLIPHALHVSADWRAEESDPGLDDASRQEQAAYIAAGLEDERIREAFRVARIEVGEIQYMMEGGRPQFLAIRAGLPSWEGGIGDPADGATKARYVAALADLSATTDALTHLERS